MNSLIAPAIWLSFVAAEPIPPSPESVFDTPEDMLQQVQKEMRETTSRPEDQIEDLAYFLFTGLGFEYRQTPTLSAAEAWRSGGGNCLSFTLLFISLARESGMEAWPREVHVPDTWRRDGNSIFSVGHVNAGVRSGQREATVDFDPDPMRGRRLASPFRGHRISENRALAHFFNNRAAELAGQNRIAWAKLWIEQAIQLDPDMVAARNTRGVISRRLGDNNAAERDFLIALDVDPDHTEVLLNLITLYRRMNRSADMVVHLSHLESLNPDDPYFHAEIARFNETIGELERARDLYRRAAELLPTPDPLVNLRLVRVLEHLGKTESAQKVLDRTLAFIREQAGDDRVSWKLPEKWQKSAGR
jgi:Flp pilus assembly protein TadD